MPLHPKAIEELKTIYRKESGRDLSDREAWAMAHRLITVSVAATHTEAMSARAPGRPVFSKLLKAVTDGTADGILCWKLDRLARNPVDGAALIWALDQGQLASIFTPQRCFTNRGDDKFWMQLEFGMAKKYVDDLSDNVKRGNRAKLEQGWLPGIPPIGYANDREKKTIKPDPERFRLVRKMWDLVLAGHPPARILKTVNGKWGLRTRKSNRRGGIPLSTSSYYKILSNPFYYGLIIRDGESFQGSHEAMVTKEEFDRVQTLLGRPDRPRPKRHRFAYTGLIQCGECGAAVTAEHKINRQDHEYTYYHCTKRLRRVTCSQRTIRVEALDDQIAAFLGTLQVSGAFCDWSLSHLEDAYRDDQLARRQSHDSVEAARSDLDRQLDRLVDLELRDQLTEGEFLAKRRTLMEKRLQLTQRLDDPESANWFEPARQSILFAHEAPARFRRGTPDEKRQLVTAAAHSLTLKDRRLTALPQEPFRILAVSKGTLRKLPAPALSSGSQPTPARFSPAKRPRFSRRNDRLAAVIPFWQAIVEEVRTFFTENPHAITFPDWTKIKGTPKRMKKG